MVMTDGAIYIDPETGRGINTHSMLKTFRRCPQQTYYKYIERLKPKSYSKPLTRGTWFHALLEAFHGGEDWREEHAKWKAKFGALFDEEREQLGDLPREIEHIMTSYIWHYKADEWKVHEVEFLLETEFPDGSLYRGKVDMLVENQYGLWIVDHKTHAKLPDLDFRLLDAQSALYVWAALRNGLPVQGHIWNYIRWKVPTTPALVYQGTSRERLTKRSVDTDYPTFVRALKAYGLNPSDYRETLQYLKSQRYQPGAMQTSAFFRRDVLEKSKGMLKRVAQEAYHTAKRMNSYEWDRVDAIERVPDRSCTFSCSYTDLCTAELLGGNPVVIRRNKYKEADPLEYYQDDRVEKELNT